MEKEKANRPLVVMTPTSLYEKFREKVEKEYKTVSIVIRDFMIEYIKDKND